MNGPPSNEPTRAPRGGGSGPGRLPTQLGRYQVLGELGRGAMGAVLRGYDPTIGRAVAIKVILGGAGASSDELIRFAREAQAAGRLSHPGIVAVHEAGSQGGMPYVVMELLERGSLEGRLARGPLPQREAAAIVRDVARAAGHAHAQGIVHRDIKPANILFGDDGRPRLADFGIARQAGSDLTVTGVLLGTPQFMAPEQAGAAGRAHGPPADVHALGAVLYQATTGQLPFPSRGLPEFLKKLTTEPPTPPRQHRPDLDPGLEAVILRCLEKDPGERYDTGRELAEALDAWLEGRAAPASASGMKAGLAALGVVVVALAVGLGVVLGRSGPPAPTPPTPPAPAPLAPITPPTPPPAAPATPVRLPPAFTGSVKLAPAAAHGSTAWRFPAFVEVITVSRDQRHAIAGDGEWWDGLYGTVKVVDLEAGRVVAEWTAHPGTIRHVAVTSGGRRAVTAGGEGLLRSWDVSAGGAVRKLAERGTAPLYGSRDWEPRVAVRGLALLPDESAVFVGWSTGELEVLGLDDLRPRWSDRLASPLVAATLLPDGRTALVIAGSNTQSVLARVPLDGGPAENLGAAPTNPWRLWPSPDGSRVIMRAHDRAGGQAWSAAVDRLAPVANPDGTASPRPLADWRDVCGVGWLPGGAPLIGRPRDLWRADGDAPASILSNRRGLGSLWVAFATARLGERTVVVAGDGHAIDLIDLARGDDLRVDAATEWPIGASWLSVARRADVAVLGLDEDVEGPLTVVDLGAGQSRTIENVGRRPACSTLSDDGRVLHAADHTAGDTAVRAFAIDPGGPIRRLRRTPWSAPATTLWSTLTLPDGSLVIADEQGLIEHWRDDAHVRLSEPQGPWPQSRTTLALGGDGTRVAAVRGTGLVQLWRREGAELRGPVEIAGTSSPLSAVALAGDWLWAAEDRHLHGWDLATGRDVRVESGHIAGVVGLAPSFDGALLVSAAADGLVLVWDLRASPPRVVGRLDLATSADRPRSVAWQESPTERLVVLTARGALLVYERR